MPSVRIASCAVAIAMIVSCSTIATALDVTGQCAALPSAGNSDALYVAPVGCAQDCKVQHCECLGGTLGTNEECVQPTATDCAAIAACETQLIQCYTFVADEVGTPEPATPTPTTLAPATPVPPTPAPPTTAPVTAAPNATAAPATPAPNATSAPPTPAPNVTAAPPTPAPNVTAAPPTPAPNVTAAPPTPAPNVTAAPPTPAPNVTAAPPTPAPNVTAAPPTPAPNVTAAPPTPAPNVTAAPPTPAPNVTAAPPTPAPNVTAAPPTPAPNVTAAPPTPAPNVTAAPATPAPNTSAPTPVPPTPVPPTPVPPTPTPPTPSPTRPPTDVPNAVCRTWAQTLKAAVNTIATGTAFAGSSLERSCQNNLCGLPSILPAAGICNFTLTSTCFMPATTTTAVTLTSTLKIANSDLVSLFLANTTESNAKLARVGNALRADIAAALGVSIDSITFTGEPTLVNGQLEVTYEVHADQTDLAARASSISLSSTNTVMGQLGLTGTVTVTVASVSVPTPAPSSSKTCGKGCIAGIVIGSFFFVVILFGLLYFIKTRCCDGGKSTGTNEPQTGSSV